MAFVESDGTTSAASIAFSDAATYALLRFEVNKWRILTSGTTGAATWMAPKNFVVGPSETGRICWVEAWGGEVFAYNYTYDPHSRLRGTTRTSAESKLAGRDLRCCRMPNRTAMHYGLRREMSAGAWTQAGSGVAEMSHTRERLRRFLIRAMSRTHGGVYRASGGRLLGRVAGMPVLLLTTTGRGSGKPRTAALTYFRDGADLVVIGSFGGSDLAARLVAQPSARSPGKRADRWDDLEGDGEGRNRRGARPALAPRDDDPPWVRPLPGAHSETDSYRDVDARGR